MKPIKPTDLFKVMRKILNYSGYIAPYDQWDEIALKVSHSPDFRSSFEISMLQDIDQVHTYLKNLPRTILNKDGVFDNIMQSKLSLRQVLIAERFRQFYDSNGISSLHYMLNLIPYDGELLIYATPYPLGYILRYVPEVLKYRDLKRQFISQLLCIMCDLHSKQLHAGPEFNVENFSYNQFFDLLQFAPPTGKYDNMIPKNLNLSQLWLDYEISNFEYIYMLNLISGRRQSIFHAPLFPWVINFAEKAPRNMTVSQFIINKGYEQVDSLFTTQLRSASEISSQALNQYLNLSAPPQDSFTSEANHTAGPAPTDLSFFCYMARRAPLSLIKKFVRPKFVAKQFCDIMGDIFKWTPEELVMEFFTEPRIFTVDLDEKFHYDQEYQHIFASDNILGNVQLSELNMNADQFVTWHMQQLNENQDIHLWLDQVFGINSDGISALCIKNLSIRRILSAYGMQSSTYQMFKQSHPVRQSEVIKSKDLKQLVVNGNANADDCLFDEQYAIQEMQRVLKNSDFSINSGFLPRTMQQLYSKQYWFSLDRVYLAQMIYQIHQASWNIEENCFLVCLDSNIANGLDVKNHGDDTLSMMISLLSPDKLFKNLPLCKEEVEVLLHCFSNVSYYEDSVLKYKLMSCVNSQQSIEEELDEMHKQLVQKQLDQSIVYKFGMFQLQKEFLWNQIDPEILNLDFVKDILNFFFKSFQLNDYMKIIWKQSFDQIIAETIFDNMVQDIKIAENEQIQCQLCNTNKIIQHNYKLPQNHYFLYKAGQLRLENSHKVIYETIINYQIVKQMLSLCVQNIQLYKLICQLQLPVQICLDILIPMGLKFIQQSIFARYDSEIEIRGLVEDLTIMLMRLNDQQIIGKIFENVLQVLLQPPVWVFDYFYKSSNLAKKMRTELDDDQISSVSTYTASQIHFDNIEKALNVLLKYMFDSMLQMMNQDMCTKYFEKLIVPLFEQRFYFLQSYLLALRSFQITATKYDTNCISYPLFQVIMVLKYMAKHTYADALSSAFFSRQTRIKNYLIDKDNYIQLLGIEKLEQNFTILQLLLINPFHTKKALQQTILHIIFVCNDIMETENVVLYEKASWSFLLCSNIKAVRDFQRILQLDVEPTYNFIQQLTKKELDNTEYNNIIQQEHQRVNKAQRTYFFAQLGISKQIAQILKTQINATAFDISIVDGNQIDIVPGSCMLEIAQNWLSYQYDINRITQMMLSKLIRPFKIITETENLFKDYQSPDSKFHLFVNYLSESILKQLTSQSTIADVLNKLSCAGEQDKIILDNTIALAQFEEQKTKTKEMTIFETFDLNVSRNNLQTTQSTIEKLTFTEYLITSNRNFQIFNTSFIGKHQKSPLVLDHKYEFTDTITCTCKLQGNKIAFGTIQGDLNIFDFESNKVAQNIVYRPPRVIVQDILKEPRTDSLKYYQQPYIQAGLEEYLEYWKKSQNFQPFQRIAVQDNLIVSASGGLIELFDIRSNKQIANIQTLEYSKSKQSLNIISPSQTALSLKISDNKILSGSENFLSYIDLRTFESETLLSDQIPFTSHFMNFGAVIMQENQTKLFEHPAISDTPLCRALGRSQINNLFSYQMGAAKACNFSKGTLHVITQNMEKQQLFVNQFKVENLFRNNNAFNPMPIKLNDGKLSIYQNLKDVGEVKTMAYDELLDCWIILDKMGVIGLMK